MLVWLTERGGNNSEIIGGLFREVPLPNSTKLQMQRMSPISSRDKGNPERSGKGWEEGARGPAKLWLSTC